MTILLRTTAIWVVCGGLVLMLRVVAEWRASPPRLNNVPLLPSRLSAFEAVWLAADLAKLAGFMAFWVAFWPILLCRWPSPPGHR